MANVLEIILPLLAIICFLVAIFFLLRTFRFRSQSSRVSYGVAQQDARQRMQTDFLRSIAAGFVSLILLSLVGLISNPDENETILPEISLTPTLIVAPSTPTTPPTATNVESQPERPPEETQTIEPTSILSEPSITPLPSLSPSPLPTNTQTPEPATATVISEAGVWLRSIPGLEGEQIEWVFNGTTLILLPGLETVDDFDWQHVRTLEGNDGWVAVPFIVYDE